MPSNKLKKRRHQAISAIKTLASEVWSIEEQTFTRLLHSLQGVAETGQAPEAIYESDSNPSKMKIAGSVAVIPITGVIRPTPDVYTRWYGGTACSNIRRDLATALGNSAVEKIIFLCDSPGGSVLQLEETAQAIFAARGEKTMETFVVGMCASAAYFLGSATGKVIAGPSTMTGSIGSKMTHVDVSKFYQEIGYTITDIQFGKHKTDGSPYRPLDEQGRNTLQEMVDAFGNQFVAAVSRNRGITTEAVLNGYGQGKVFIASEALDRKMIDAIGTFEITEGSQSPTIVTNNKSESSVQTTFVVETQTGIIAKTNSENEVNKVKALMFGLGMIKSIDVSDETAEAVLIGYCAAKGVDSPVDAEGNVDQSKAISILKGANASATITAVETLQPASNVQAAHDQEVAQAKAAAIKSYQERRDNLMAIAKLVNQSAAKEVVSVAMIDAAVSDESKTTDVVRAEWSEKIDAGLSGGAGGVIVGNGGNGGQFSITEGEDVFSQSCVNALMHRAGMALQDQQLQQLRTTGRDATNMSLSQMADKCLSYLGISTVGMTNEDAASLALQGSSPGARTSFSSRFAGIDSEAPAYNRPGDFSYILSNLAGMTLDNTIELAKTTYQMFSQQLPDTNDFKPSTFLLMGSFTSLDKIPDGDKYKELKFSEELRGRISVDRHGNQVKMTPKMMVDDAAGLDAFVQQLRTLAYALENTITEANLSLITSNVNLADGKPLFNADAGNLIVEGGPPSIDQAEKMDLAHSAFKGVKTEKPVKSEPDLALIPKALNRPAMTTYAPFGSLPEMKVADNDNDLNIYRGSLDKGIAYDTDLDLASKVAWYTFDTMLRTITHQFQVGYGRGGKRETWFNPENNCRSFSLEGRFGVSAMGRRGIVKNTGTPA